MMGGMSGNELLLCTCVSLGHFSWFLLHLHETVASLPRNALHFPTLLSSPRTVTKSSSFPSSLPHPLFRCHPTSL
ncbi:hypothetical protein BKA65DRAFT_516730 [Rhexocercosporidium sp. MPI-PUGE-AT-0058]|nr:hypothetical protein BKA65DRAFT_516730 [Rhexocercosporidium sp. MPI-PUGE-AT-0058]